MQGRCILLFTETFIFRPLQQGKTPYQLPGMASDDSADITSFEKRRQKWTLKTFYETL